MGIQIDKITDRQKLVIAKGLCDYAYIMEHWTSNDSDFRDVYYDFYLKARWAVMGKEYRNKYFEKLQTINIDDNIESVLNALKTKKKGSSKESYEFSIVSKLLHTRNPNLPIYDSKVRNYLSDEGVEFWWQGKGAPHNTTEINKIKHDWSALCSWYSSFIDSSKGKQWLMWFDETYPEHVNITSVKKIDFIIFATR